MKRVGDIDILKYRRCMVCDIPFIEHTPEAIRKCWHVLFPEDEGSCSSQETEKRNGGKA